MSLFRSKWNTNKNFRGSYTYYKLKEPSEDDVFIQDLETPIGEPKPVSKLFVNGAYIKKKFYNLFFCFRKFYLRERQPIHTCLELYEVQFILDIVKLEG